MNPGCFVLLILGPFWFLMFLWMSHLHKEAEKRCNRSLTLCDELLATCHKWEKTYNTLYQLYQQVTKPKE